MSGTHSHLSKKSSDIAPSPPRESQLQRRPFPHEVDSQDEKAATPAASRSTETPESENNVAQARFDPNRVSLYPVDPLKDEQEKPIQKQAESAAEKEEEPEPSVQKQAETKTETKAEKEEEPEKSVQPKGSETAAEEKEEPEQSIQAKAEPEPEEEGSPSVQKQGEAAESEPEKEEPEQPIQKRTESPESEPEKDQSVQQQTDATAEPEQEEADKSVQRKMEGAETEEPEPQEENSPSRSVQTKLSVGKPGDRYEQEADQVAAKVMRMPDLSQNRIQRQPDGAYPNLQPKSLATAITPLVQRQASPNRFKQQGQRAGADFENRLSSSQGGGNLLPDDVRSFMEQRFGTDLSHVRVHTDEDAARMSKDIKAQAFTYRNHIFYAAGKAPGKDELTAHELTHVVQQTGAKPLSEGAVRRSPKEAASIQPKSLESQEKQTEENKLTPAETVIQRQPISEASPQIQGDWRDNRFVRGAATVGGGAVDVATGDVEGAKRRLLDSVAGFASRMPGYSLLTVILGKDPIKDEPVARNATNLVRGILELVPGGDRLFQNLQESGALQKAFDWFEKELKRLNLTWNAIKTLFRRAVDALSMSTILNPGRAIEDLANLFKDPIRRITRFAGAVGKKVMEFVFEGAMALAGKGGADQVMGILKKVGGLFKKIIKDPVGFVGNLVRSVKGGFEQFSGNIMAHLKAGLMGWLFGALSGSGLQMPAALNLKGMLSIALQVVGATYQKLRKRLVKRMGEKKVSQVEKAFTLLRSIASGGLIAAWKEISQSTGDVKEMVISEVRNWVITTIIKKAVLKLVSMFNPAGAVVQAVIAVYNTVMFFIERWQQILDLANAVFHSIQSIAAGKIKAAIKFIEQSMAKSLPVIISFMARLLGLGGISNRIRNIIKRMQRPIDRAMNRIIDKVVRFARRLARKTRETKETIFEWWKVKKRFKSQDNKTHTLFFKGKDKSAKLMIASTPKVLEGFIKGLLASPNTSDDDKKILAQISNHAQAVEYFRGRLDNRPRKNRSINQKYSKHLASTLGAIAKLLSQLTGVDGSLPKTEVQWKTRTWGGDKDGQYMLAEPLSLKPGKTLGSDPYESSNLWNKVSTRKGEYVRGHLLNHNVHGPGIKKNLTPLTDEFNKEMEKEVESKVKKLVLSDKKVLSYKVFVQYGGHPKRNFIPAESSLATQLEFEIHEMQKKPGTSGTNSRDWIKASLVYSKTLNHKLPKDTPID